MTCLSADWVVPCLSPFCKIADDYPFQRALGRQFLSAVCRFLEFARPSFLSTSLLFPSVIRRCDGAESCRRYVVRYPHHHPYFGYSTYFSIFGSMT